MKEPRNILFDKLLMVLLIVFLTSLCSGFLYSQRVSDNEVIEKGIRHSTSVLEQFTTNITRRTIKANRRITRYERKMRSVSTDVPATASATAHISSGLGKEPLFDSLRVVYAFAEHAVIQPGKQQSDQTEETLERAQHQLNITQQFENRLLQRTEYWQSQVTEHPEYVKWTGRMDKERYYYSAQINTYRQSLRNTSILEDGLMDALRRDSRFVDFMSSLPSKPSNPANMQPRHVVEQLMQSQASSVSQDAGRLIGDVQKHGESLLEVLNTHTASFGNIDNASQLPGFIPNPYRTKSLWERMDIGFNLQFDNRTEFIPPAGTAGVQLSYNIDASFSTGILGSYRFGIGDIKHIRISHAGAGYGAFANYKVWKDFGVQAGYEHNWHTEMEIDEIEYPSGWSSSALGGLTWEYGIGRNMSGTVGVFYDFLHKRHTPVKSAILWRMGWKF